MEISCTGVTKLNMEYVKGATKPSLTSVEFNLQVSSNLDKDAYFENHVPNATGTKTLTQCFIQGLIGNIHRAHQMGYWNDAEHLRFIIAELEKGFVENVTTETSKFTG